MHIFILNTTNILINKSTMAIIKLLRKTIFVLNISVSLEKLEVDMYQAEGQFLL